MFVGKERRIGATSERQRDTRAIVGLLLFEHAHMQDAIGVATRLFSSSRASGHSVESSRVVALVDDQHVQALSGVSSDCVSGHNFQLNQTTNKQTNK